MSLSYSLEMKAADSSETLVPPSNYITLHSKHLNLDIAVTTTNLIYDFVLGDAMVDCYWPSYRNRSHMTDK
jgi:hypothetical protein